MEKLTEKSKVKIYNNTLGSASFILDGKRYGFPKYKSDKKLSLEIISDLYNDYPSAIEGGMFAFYDKRVYDFLEVDEEILKKILTPSQIEELLEKDAKEIEKTLDNVSDISKENVAKIAKRKKIDSTKTRKVIEKATGFDIETEDEDNEK